MGEFKFLQYGRTGDLIRIAINRPPFNVLDIATMQEMNVALDRALEEPGAKALMLTGAGEKAFSAGVDVADHTQDCVVGNVVPVVEILELRRGHRLERFERG